MTIDSAEEHLDEDAYLPDEDYEDNQDNFSPAVRTLIAKFGQGSAASRLN